MDLSEIAQRALEIAVIANTRIEEHEKTCAERWRIVVKTNFIMVTVLLAVLGGVTKIAFFASI